MCDLTIGGVVEAVVEDSVGYDRNSLDLVEAKNTIHQFRFDFGVQGLVGVLVCPCCPCHHPQQRQNLQDHCSFVARQAYENILKIGDNVNQRGITVAV
jgi:hypothetical protein